MDDIHQQIKAAREQKGWSMARLAAEVSKAEGRPEGQYLNWQTVQQWEKGTSAPKRTRMELVRQLLELDPPSTKGEVFHRVNDDEWTMLQNYRRLLDKDRKAFDAEIAARAAERQAEADEIFARYGVAQAAERANARRQDTSTITVDPADPRLRQESLFDPGEEPEA
jgi:transcriptional regulator with XRE-family HTH domain